MPGFDGQAIAIVYRSKTTFRQIKHDKQASSYQFYRSLPETVMEPYTAFFERFIN